jgi:electron transport complex protein RnfB
MSGRLIRLSVLSVVSARPIVWLHPLHQNVCMHSRCAAIAICGVKTISTGAENQLCPTGAITRKFIEEPYFEYTINEDLCDGCAKCVKGCGDFGNGSLYMQIRHNLCENCNDCSIARTCPSEAISRVPALTPYLQKDKGKKRNSESQG